MLVTVSTPPTTVTISGGRSIPERKREPDGGRIQVYHGSCVMSDADRFDHLEHLLVSFKESLETEIGELRGELRAEMRNGFEQVNARLARVDLVWKVVREWGRGMDDLAIKSDEIIARHERQLASFEERLSRLERDKLQ